MLPFVPPALLQKKIAEFDAEVPQIRFPAKFLTRCVFTYSLLLFLVFFAGYHLFVLVSVAAGTLAIIYMLLLGKLFSVLRLSVWRYIVFNILWWIALWFFASCARMAFVSLLTRLL